VRTAADKIKIIGVGNPWRGDDGAGPWVARRLREKLPARIIVEECTGDLTRLLELGRGVERLILIDVVDSGAAAGTLQCIGAGDGRLLRGKSVSCHATGIVGALELGRALQLLPDDWRIYAIEGKDFALGAPISPAVVAGAERAVAAIIAALGDAAAEVRHA